MEEFGNWVWDWFGVVENRDRTTAIATAIGTIIAVLLFLGALVAGFIRLIRRRPDPPPHQPPALPVDPKEPVMSMPRSVFEAELNKRAAEVEAELATASEDERTRLEGERAEIASKLADVEGALKEREAKVRELEALLAREGNAIGGDRLAEARAALEQGDFSKADELFAEIEARDQMAVQSSARAAYGRGEIAEEEVRWADAAEHYGRAAGLDQTFDTLYKAREFAWRAGDNTRAAGFGEDLIRVAREEFGDESAKLAEALNEHALTIEALGRYAEAEPLFRQALEIDAKTIGTEHPRYAEHLNNLAALLQVMGRHDEAEPLYRQALEIDAKTIGTEHPSYAVDLNNLAGLLQVMGRHDEAEPLFRQALEIDAKTIGTAHPEYAIHLNNLANLLADMGRTAVAEPLFRQAMEIDEKTIGTEHPDYAIHLNNLALLLKDLGRYDEAGPLYAQMMPILRGKLGDDHPDTRAGAANYARLLRAQFPDDPALAELEAAFGPDIGQ